MENLLALLPYLACPIGMGAAMWLMMRRPAQGTDSTAPAAQSRRVNRARAEGSSSAPTPWPVLVARATSISLPRLGIKLVARAGSISLPRLMWLVWLMMRGNPTRQPTDSGTRAGDRDGAPSLPTAETSAGARLAALRAELGELQAQHAAIAAQVARLSADHTPAGPQTAVRADGRQPARGRQRRASRTRHGHRVQVAPQDDRRLQE